MGKGFDDLAAPGDGGIFSSIKNIPSYYAKNTVESWRYEAQSGDLESFVQKKPIGANGTPTYQVDGPSGTDLVGIRANAAGDHFLQATPSDNLVIPKGTPWVFISQIYHDNNVAQPVNGDFFDMHYESGFGSGFQVRINSTNLDFRMSDDSGNVHVTNHIHGGIIWKEEKFYTLRWVFVPNEPSARLFIKEAGQPEFQAITQAQTSGGLDPYTSIEDLNFSSNPPQMFSDFDTNNNEFLGVKYQDVIKIGSTKYELPLVP